MRAITLHFQPVLQHYKQRTVSASAINPVTTEIMDDSCLQMYGSHVLHYHELTPWVVSIKKKTLWYTKGMSRDEAMLNSEKIKPVVLAVIELCLPEGISRLVSRKFH